MIDKHSYQMISIGKIRPSPYQPREYFDNEKIRELADSIEEAGLIEPIIVRPVDGKYELVAGERRIRAVHLLKWEEIPAIVRMDLSNVDAMELSLIENIHREDLTSVEKEKMVTKMWEVGQSTTPPRYRSKAELARKLGYKDPTSVRKILIAGELRESDNIPKDVSTQIVIRTTTLEPEDRKRVIELTQLGVKGGGLSKDDGEVASFVKIVKQASESGATAVKEAILTPGSHVKPDIAKKILEVPNQKEQEQLVKKIEKERLDERQVEKVVDVIKRAQEPVREAILKPESKITPEIAEKIIEFPEKEQQKEIIKEIEKAKMIEEAGIKAFVEDRLDIAKGKRAPDITIRDQDKRLVELYGRIYSDVITISAEHVMALPLAYRNEAIEYMKKSHNHIGRELIKVERS